MTSRAAKQVAKKVADDLKVTRRKLSDYRFDDANPNKGSERGDSLLETSVEQFGPARSGVVDKDGVLRAGNHTAQQLLDAGIEDVIEVETDGKQWVVVKRADMTPEQGEQYAVADNRTGQFIEWDSDVLKALQEQDVKLDDYFLKDEMESILGSLPDSGDAGTNEIPAVYGVLIECSSEAEQTKMLTKLLADGIKCRALLS